MKLVANKYCPKCYGLPHRREDNGKTCLCGGRYAPEVVPVEIPFRNNDRVGFDYSSPRRQPQRAK